MKKSLQLIGGGATGQIRRDVQSGCILDDRLWNLQDLQKKHFSKTFQLQEHIDEIPEDEVAEGETGTVPTSAPTTELKATVDMSVGATKDISAWLAALKRGKIFLVVNSCSCCR